MAQTRIDPLKGTVVIFNDAEYQLAINSLIASTFVFDNHQTVELDKIINSKFITRKQVAWLDRLKAELASDLSIGLACDLLRGKPKAKEAAEEVKKIETSSNENQENKNPETKPEGSGQPAPVGTEVA